MARWLPIARFAGGPRLALSRAPRLFASRAFAGAWPRRLARSRLQSRLVATRHIPRDRRAPQANSSTDLVQFGF